MSTTERDDFGDGYSDDELATTTPLMNEGEQPQDAPQDVKYAKIKEDEYQTMLTRLAEIDAIKADHKTKFDTAMGKLGEFNRTIDSFRNQSTGGLEMTAAELAEIRAEYPDYPELADMQVKIIQRFMKNKGGVSQVDPSLVEKIYQERFVPELQKISGDFQAKTTDLYLKQDHRDWVDVVKSQPFKDWTLQEKLADSWDPAVISGYITKYKEATAQKETKPGNTQASIRQKRLEQAVNPKGSGGHASSKNDELSDFLSGYSDD